MTEATGNRTGLIFSPGPKPGTRKRRGRFVLNNKGTLHLSRT